MNLKYSHFIIYSFLFVLSSTSLVLAHTIDSLIQTYPIRIDNAPIVSRPIDQSKLNSYINDDDFKYDENFEKPQNILAQLIWWLNRQMELYKAIKYTWQYGKYILMGLAIVLILMHVLKVPIKGIFSSKIVKNHIPFQIAEEQIHEMDFDNLIKEALQKQLYRNAIRYYYLKTLKQLSDKNYIQWQQEKTNTEYVNEITSSELKNEFAFITFVFEKIWYGEFLATKKHIEEIEPSCLKVENIISNKQVEK